MRASRSFLFLFILVCFSICSYAQTTLSTGIINSNRAVDWTQAGIPGGLPDAGWSQCGSTISPYSGTAAAIVSQLASCGANQYVLLGAGTFNLSTGINFPANTSGHVVLRGSGANSTFLVFGSNAGFNCGGFNLAFICIMSSDGTYPGEPGLTLLNWSGGYAQGSTQITLSSVSGISLNKTLILLNQCDTGYSGSPCSGNSVDNGNYFACSALWNGSTGCSVNGPDGSAFGANRWQTEIVTATAINQGGCGSTCVTISQPLKHPNWASSQTPQAILIQPVPQDGVENLAIDGTAATGTSAGIQFYNAYQGWVSGVKISNIYEWFINNIDVSHMVFQNNYLYHANGHPDPYGIRVEDGGDNLILNNIVEQVRIATSFDGFSSGDVTAYNYSVNQMYASDFMFGAFWNHSEGDDAELWEGNVGDQMQNDNLHGSHLMETKFRNFFTGWESCANGQCGSTKAKDSGTNAMTDVSNARYTNNIANVLGTAGYHTGYQTTSTPASNLTAYAIGIGNGSISPTLPTDPMVAATMMRWGNYDVVTGAARWCGNSSDTGWSSVCAGTSEIPTGINPYSNSVPTVGDVGAGQPPLPPSFFYSSKPSWWGSHVWPPIGPDVSGGNVGMCSGTLNTAGHYSGLPASSSSQCTGTSMVASWGGHVNLTPAMDCYLNIMGGPPDGTGGQLAFDPVACYGNAFPPPQGLQGTGH
jgi:hypothetical protein